MIPQSFIDDIQAKTDIAELISGYITVKRAGRNFKACCPFHGERTPSFMVSAQKQIFHCFGCGVGGGALKFIELHEKVTFPEAVEILAKRLGLEVPNDYKPKDTETFKAKASLSGALHEASLFFHNKLLADALPQGPMKYIASRGIGPEIIKEFCLGYAPGRDNLVQYLRNKNFTLEMLEKASLAFSRQGQWRDMFADRLMFPIFDVRGNCVAFGGRLWKDIPDAPKYINSLESPVYSKREHLFGLHASRKYVSEADSIVIVEGYLDMIVPYAAGVKNIAASLGTALTAEQIRLIKRYTHTVVLAFDSDKAGISATNRAIDILLEHQMNVAVAVLPAGFDPDSLVRAQGGQAMRAAIAQAQNFFEYKLHALRCTHDIATASGKTALVMDLFGTLSKISSEMERQEYFKKLAGALNIRFEAVWADWQKFAGSQRPGVRMVETVMSNARPPLRHARTPITEKVLLKAILTNTKAYRIVREAVTENDFSDSMARKTVAYMFTHYSGAEQFNPAAVAETDISAFIAAILLDDTVPLDVEVFKSCIEKMRKNRLRNTCRLLQEGIRAAQEAGDRLKARNLMEEHSRLAESIRQ